MIIDGFNTCYSLIYAMNMDGKYKYFIAFIIGLIYDVLYTTNFYHPLIFVLLIFIYNYSFKYIDKKYNIVVFILIIVSYSLIFKYNIFYNLIYLAIKKLSNDYRYLKYIL